MLDVYDLYKVILNENSLVSKIEKGIDRGDIVVIDYDPEDDDPDKQTLGKGRRVVIPFTFGVSKAGNKVVRCWQLSGKSRTPNGDGRDPLKNIAGWRMFRVDRIKSWNRSARTLDRAFVEALDPNEKNQIRKYNPQDKDMTTIYKSSTIADEFKRG